MLEQWLKRSRRDERVDWRGVYPSCFEEDRACDPIPVERRVRTDFLWQRSPFLLYGGGAGLRDQHARGDVSRDSGGLLLWHWSGPNAAAMLSVSLAETGDDLPVLASSYAGMFAAIQQSKALADQRHFDSAAQVFSHMQPQLDRFPALISHAQEAVGQIQAMTTDPEALASFGKAISAAEQSGLLLRRELLLRLHGQRASV